MPEYSHTLIPGRVDFVPEPKQVGSFLSSLATIGAAPLKPAFVVSMPSGKVRTFKNPISGIMQTFAGRESEELDDLTAVAGALKRLEDYDVSVAGKGPPKLKAFTFDFKGKYDFFVRCCLRPEVVSMSDWHDEVPIERKVESFGQQCSPKDRLGIYLNPNTLEVIEVPNAGCARFWIEFEYGNLFPSIKDRLDLIEPAIAEVAEKEFAIKFVQGCHWGA
ncbi:MAG: hypothetical protein JWN70_5322 [Planctomycetaceae bacterium]|nr:hypothetical protein [Planctomycetaceae bacterium]